MTPTTTIELERTPGKAVVSENIPKGAAARLTHLAAAPGNHKQKSKSTTRKKSYKDSLAKSTTSKNATCGSYAIVCDCVSGKHHFAKKLVCGREWCSVCGADNSASHKRRQARILPKLQQVSELGYFVIEFPNFYRHVGQRGLNPDSDAGHQVQGWCYSKADLQDTTKKIVNVLAGIRRGRRGRVGGYFSRGLARWHWFGDKKPGKWNPHLNVLVDGGHMAPELLQKIKAELRTTLNVPDLIVHYSYFNQPGQLVQKARYCTRATFLNETWDQYMSAELYNFRNMRWWGPWKNVPVWDLHQAEAQGADVSGLETIVNLQTGICPDCGAPLKVLYYNHKKHGSMPILWSRPIDSVYLGILGAEEISNTGYYRIPHREFNGHAYLPGGIGTLKDESEFTTDEKLRLWLLRQERRGEPISVPQIRRIKLTDNDRKYLGIPLDNSD